MSDKEQDRQNLGKFFSTMMIVAVFLLILGYVILAQNEISLSSVLLLVGYAVLIPMALLWRPKKKDQ